MGFAWGEKNPTATGSPPWRAMFSLNLMRCLIAAAIICPPHFFAQKKVCGLNKNKHLKIKTHTKNVHLHFFLFLFCFRFQVGQIFAQQFQLHLPTPQNEFPPRLKPHEREIGPGYCFLNGVHLSGHFCWVQDPTVWVGSDVGPSKTLRGEVVLLTHPWLP